MISSHFPLLLARAARDAGSGASSSDAASTPTFVGDLVGLVITVLQVGQYVPQHVEMFQDRSTAGLSPWLIFFGSLYTYAAFLDLALTETAPVVSCTGGAYRCFISALPFLQMFLSALLSFALWYWFLLFYGTSDASIANDESHITSSMLGKFFYDSLPPRLFFQLNVGAFVAVTSFALVLVRQGNLSRVTAYAHFCGNAAAVLNAVMWLPQIITTLAYGHKGALSIWWVISSVVMDIVYSVYLAVLGFDVSVWVNNVPDAVQTSILFGIIVYYERRDRERGTDDFGRRLSMMQRLRRGAESGSETLALLKTRRNHPPKHSSEGGAAVREKSTETTRYESIPEVEEG